MATRQQFVDEMEKVYKGHGIYIGGANGELTESLTIKQIRQFEEGYEGRDHASDIRRDLTYIGNCYGKGWSMKESYSGDCSGQVVGALRRLGVTKSDYQARTFQKLSTPIALKDLIPSDLLFNKKSESTHMAVYVGGPDYVIESKGRDAGVVKRHLQDTEFIIGGRLDWFDDSAKVLTRILKYIPDNMMRGEDVKEVQRQLQLEGYTPGTADGIYGKKSKIAVQAFQLDHNLNADGIVGKNTAEALGFKWGADK